MIESDYTCVTCGDIPAMDVVVHKFVDHVPYGDQSVPMYSYEYSCNYCGNEVEYND